MIARVIASLVAMSALLATTSASARCGDEGVAWVKACAAEQHLEMSLESCPAGVAIVAVRPENAPPLRVELSTSTTPFLRVNGVGLAPVGSFADWKAEPPSTRAAFDAVAACVRARQPNALLSQDAATPVPLASPKVFSWPLLFAAIVSLASCIVTRRARSNAPRVLAATLVSALVCFALRRWLVPIHFFHQNGQAPLWVEFAMRGDAGAYGPGYAEIFQPWIAHARRPDLRLFLVQELAAAFAPACVFAIARAAGARRGVAALFAIAFALDPLAMRLARSESYFATILTLLLFAGAMLSSRAHLVLRACAAGLLIAAAARIHPLAWVPGAALPLLLLARRGRTMRVLRETLVAGVVVAAIVAVAALPAMREVLRGDLGTRFLPGALILLRRYAPMLLFSAAVALPLLIVRRTRSFGRRAIVLAVVIAAAIASNVVRIDIAMISAAYLHLFAPVAIGALSALIALLPGRAAVLAAAVILALHVPMDRRVIVVPTDAREQELWLTWRESLPEGAIVVWVERAGTRVLALPFANIAIHPRPIQGEGHADLPTSGRRYYYRSSLCSTPDGAPLCARFESAHRLRSLDRRALPAIASQPWNPLLVSEMAVELFALEEP